MCACPRKAFCLTVDLLIVSVLFLTAGGNKGLRVVSVTRSSPQGQDLFWVGDQW